MDVSERIGPSAHQRRTSDVVRCHWTVDLNTELPHDAVFGSRAQTLRVTLAMESGIASHVWSIEEIVGLVDAVEKKAA